jgi:hypothetical protein
MDLAEDIADLLTRGHGVITMVEPLGPPPSGSGSVPTAWSGWSPTVG